MNITEMGLHTLAFDQNLVTIRNATGEDGSLGQNGIGGHKGGGEGCLVEVVLQG